VLQIMLVTAFTHAFWRADETYVKSKVAESVLRGTTVDKNAAYPHAIEAFISSAILSTEPHKLSVHNMADGE